MPTVTGANKKGIIRIPYGLWSAIITEISRSAAALKVKILRIAKITRFRAYSGATLKPRKAFVTTVTCD